MPGLFPTHPAFKYFRPGMYGGHGLLNDFWLTQIRKDPELSAAIFCVDLFFGTDKVVRVASRECSTTSSTTGKRRSYRGLLDSIPDISWEMSPGDPSSSGKSVSFMLPNELVDAAELIRSGRLLSGVAEISLQIDGADYDNRIVLMRGDLTDVQYGAIEQMVQCTVQDPKETSDMLLPPYVMTTERHSGLLEGEVGKALPIVFPESGTHIQGRFISNSIASPDVVVCHGSRTIDEVTVDGVVHSTTSVSYPHQTITALDDLGEPYTAIRFTGGFGSFDGEGGPAVYAKLSGGPTNGHPVQVSRELVQAFSALGVLGAVPYLFALAEAKTGYLTSNVVANASGGSSAKTLSFIESEILGSFPMLSMIWWGGGYGPVAADRRDRRIAAMLEADVWPVFDRASLVIETPKADCVNSFSIRYKYDALNDVWNGYSQRDHTNSALCDYSRLAVGSRAQDPIESLWIHDDATANAVLDWFVAHRTLPSYDVEYDCSPQLALRLIPGDNVKMTDSEFGWDEQVATVTKIVWRPVKSTITLRIWSPVLAKVGQAGGYGGVSASAPGGN